MSRDRRLYRLPATLIANRTAFPPGAWAPGRSGSRSASQAASKSADPPDAARPFRRPLLALFPPIFEIVAKYFIARYYHRIMLRCPACNTAKPPSEFSPGQYAKIQDCGRGACRDCARAARIEAGRQRRPGWERKTADMKAYQREYQKSNREKLNASRRAWLMKREAESPGWQARREREKYERKKRRANPDWRPHEPQSPEEKAATRRAREKRRYCRLLQTRPERMRAKMLVKNAIARGLLIRQPCSECGDPKGEAHHPDYSRPLDVIWLCRKHHIAAHHAK